MSRINEKLGMAPQTRARQATHSKGLVTRAVCGVCRGRHVVSNPIHGRDTWLCGFCGHVWEPTGAELEQIATVKGATV